MTRSTMARFGGLDLILVRQTGSLALWACSTLSAGCVTSAMDALADDQADGSSSSGSGSGEDGSGGGASSDESADGSGGATIDCGQAEADALAILEANCAGCHGAIPDVAGFGFVTDPDKLRLSGMVIPGDAAGSPMFAKIADGSMPPATAPSEPSSEDVERIGEWIDQCLDQPVGGCADQSWISEAEMVAIMREDINAVPASDLPFTRYLTLTHLHNAGYCDDELDVARYALNKVLNSLSLDPIIRQPVAIDQGRTIYRIDLRDLDWDISQGIDKWERLVAENPYAFRRIDGEAVVLQGLTKTEVPFMAADWLIHDATEPPLYYDMVDIPETLQELEARLGINVQQNILDTEVDRAGFMSSGVSQSNRLYERHQLGAGGSAYWVSYDFAGNSGRQDLFTNPLDFDADGGEMIYNLPNGMQAYVIATAEGIRIDEAPTGIVTDPLQSDGVVRAGISCMSCHDAGLKFKADELREHVLGSSDFDAEDKDLIRDLHPLNDDMKEFVDLGNGTFAGAMAALWDGAPPSEEPIIEVYAAFEANVSLELAAAELGLEPEKLLPKLGSLDPSYLRLVDGVIARETFEAKFAESVCRLNLGVNDDPACEPGD